MQPYKPPTSLMNSGYKPKSKALFGGGNNAPSKSSVATFFGNLFNKPKAAAPTYPTPTGNAPAVYPTPSGRPPTTAPVSGNVSGTNPQLKSSAAQQYIGSQLGGGNAAAGPSSVPIPTPPGGNALASGTQTPSGPIASPEPAPVIKTPKDKYLEFLNSDKVKQAGETVDEFNKRTSEEIARNRAAEEGIEANEIGALQSGVDSRLTEEARKSNKSLADIALAKGYASDIYTRMLAEGKDQYEAEQEAFKAVEEANKPLTIDEAAELGVPYGTTYAGAAKLGKTPQGKGFSLSEGQAQYDAQGNLIASRGKTYAPGTGGGGIAGFSGTLSPLAQAVQNGTITIDKLPAAQRAQVAAELATSGLPTSRQQALASTGELINSLLNNPALNKIAGVQGVSTIIPGTQAQLAKNQYKQLQGLLSLEQREKLKGTGAISDFEFKILNDAASTLGRNLSDAAFREQLQKIKDVIDGKYALTQATGGGSSTSSGGGDPLGVL